MKRIKKLLGIKSEFEKQNWNDLRVIRTAWTVDEMNEALDSDFDLHFVDYHQNPQVNMKLLVVKDKETGKIGYHSDYRLLMTSGDILINTYYGNFPLKTTLPFAAYILPKDIKKNEYVVIGHVIEDLIEGYWNQGDTVLLTMCIARWTGNKFIYDHDPKQAKKNHFVG